MKLVIDPEEYPDVKETLLEIKKSGLQDENSHWFIHVMDGSWSLWTRANWYRNQPNPCLSQNPLLGQSRDPLLIQKIEGGKQWFFYSTAQFRKELETNISAFRHFGPNQGLEFLRGFTYGIVLTADIKATWDSPNEISWDKRQEIVNLIENMALNYPEYPVWADSFPIAILGDLIRYWRDEAGSVFCPINEEWALEISIEAWLHYRKPTDQEIQMIEKALP
jgi:hypothetical protein